MPRDMRVVPYDGQWPTQFEAVKAALAAIFGDLAVDIQHVGSTSIVGMWANRFSTSSSWSRISRPWTG